MSWLLDTLIEVISSCLYIDTSLQCAVSLIIFATFLPAHIYTSHFQETRPRSKIFIMASGGTDTPSKKDFPLEEDAALGRSKSVTGRNCSSTREKTTFKKFCADLNRANSSWSHPRATQELLRLLRPRHQLLPRELVVRHLHGPRHGHQLWWPCSTRLRHHPHHHRVRRYRRVAIRVGLGYAGCRRTIFLDEPTCQQTLQPISVLPDRMDRLGWLFVYLR